MACFTLCALTGHGQEIRHYDLNIYNDLPSNNVYNLTVDRYGYLWIATDKGIVKYNGYNLKTFDLNKGFINKDSWNLFEDKSGRMWLFNLSDNLNYIYNDQPHNVKMAKSMGTFYPRNIIDYKDGIGIITSFTNLMKLAFCFVRNDSMIYTYNITKYGEFVDLNSKKQLITIDTNGYTHNLDISIDGINDNISGKIDYPDTGMARLRKSMTDERYGASKTSFFSYTYNKKYIRFLDLKEFTYNTVSLDSEDIKFVYKAKNQLTAITENKIFSLYDDLRIKSNLPINSISDHLKGSKIAFLLNDPFWKQALATNIEGVIFVEPSDTVIKKIYLPNIEESRYLGSIYDSVSFWYNQSTNMLTKMVNKSIVKQKVLTIPDMAKVLPYSKKYTLLFNNMRTFLLDNNTLEISVCSTSCGAKNAIKTAYNKALCISNIYGFYEATFNNEKVSAHSIEHNRYNGIIYDSVRQMYIVYNNHKILLYANDKTIFDIKQSDLEASGINNISKILVDNRYGNLLIQEGERLLAFSSPTAPYTTIFNNYVLNSASVLIKKDVVVVSDAFGILFSKIEGPGRFSKPVVYPNAKGMRYRVINDMQVVGNVILLKTDKGLFELPFPQESAYNTSNIDYFLDYRMTVTNTQNTYSINKHDTLSIGRRSRKLQFDIIKPTGFGKVTYAYRIEDEAAGWIELSNDELTLPRLQPGKYYTIDITAHDKQWKSDVRKFTLYTIPEWYERTFIKRFLWIGGLVALLAIIYLIVVITQRTAVRKAAQRNQRLEMELKSVYSQINPHFIFNSLTASMYLIKTGKLDDAYNHIYKFSHLLRSYIKSSRNRLISLSEEIKNLTNYIELQQVRFKNKFDYTIRVEESVNTNINIPSLLLQPIVENAITHGLLHKSEKGNLLLEFKMSEGDSTLICNIEDDGIGRDQAKDINLDYIVKEESYGNELIKELINTFNKYEKMRIEIEYFDKQPPLSGTIVQLRIKQLY